MPVPGKKNVRGEADLRSEVKSAHLSTQLTPTGKRLLVEMGKVVGSISEVLEGLARGTFTPTRSIADLIRAKRSYLIENTCLIESRLTELENGLPITAQEIGKIAYALDLKISYLEELADVCGIVEPGAMPEKGNSNPDSANLPDQACSRD